MSDLLERLAAANPVCECEPPSIEEVWRKISGPDASLPPGGPRRRRRRSLDVRGVLPAITALAISMLVVIVVVMPLLGARHGRARGAASGASSYPRTTVDPAGQEVAAQQLAGRVGAVVAIDPRTGAVKVLYGSRSPGGAAQRTAGIGAGLVAAEAEYPPAGTFDVVTATAALDIGRYTPHSRTAGPSPLVVSGAPLHNTEDESFGPITLTQALDDSVNTVFAQVGETVGRQTMASYMKRFGFYASPALNAPSVPIPASGVRVHGRLTLPTDPRVDLGRLAIGQGGLTVTPLQMAMVVSAIAHGGQLMNPRLTGPESTLSGHVMKPATARAVASMMRDVVMRGTATPAHLKGVQVAGKTGNAEIGGGRSDPWFIGFAPADHPTIAIAVVLRNVRGGYGGTDAAPIARRVLQTLLAARP
jgi:peptidoglycan glycosyltransferase